MPVSSDIIALLANQGNAQAAGALRQGDIAAQEAARKQALWASIIGTGINVATNLPGQIAQMRDARALADERRAKVQAAQMDMQGRMALGQTIHEMTDPQTGHADPQKVADALSSKGFPQVANAWLKTNTENAEALDKLRKMEEDRWKSQLALVGDLAYSAGDDPDKFAAGLGLLATHKVIDPQTALKFGELTQSDDWKVLRDKVLPLSPKWQAEQAEKNKPFTLKEDETRFEGGKAVASGGAGKPKTEAELRFDAQNPNSPTQAISAAALAEQNKNKPGTSEQDDQRYRQIQADLLAKKPVSTDELNWAKGYEKQKTLGVDTSASAAAIRQAASIAAQTAQQARGQNFAESQAGRKELSDKVEQPYLDAREKADTLRSVIAAARGGNMQAASVQSLLGTLGLVTSEGIKRINTTEIQNVAGAGSLLERIKSQAGSVVSGQKLSPKLQKDLEDLSGLLEKAAYNKYSESFDRTTKRYGLTDEQKLPAPGSAVTATSDSDLVKKLNERRKSGA